MKTFKNLVRKAVKALKRLAAPVAIASCLVLSARAQLIISNNPPMTVFTNVINANTLIVGGGVTTNLLTTNGLVQSLIVNPGYGFALDVLYGSGTNTTTTSNVTWTVRLSVDGTNWPSAITYTLVRPLSGTTMQEYVTNFAATYIDGFYRVSLYTEQNGDSVSAITNGWARLSRARIRPSQLQ